jgi:hypothetical protein
MAWLLREGEVLASCSAVQASRFGHIRLDPSLGVQILPCRAIAQSGRLGIDLVFLGKQHEVTSLRSLRAWSPIFYWHAHSFVVAAPKGAFGRWSLRIGDKLEIR